MAAISPNNCAPAATPSAPRARAHTHDEAPPFRTFAEKWPVDHLGEALAEGITVGHADMPEFVLQPDEIDAFIAYLESLE